MASDAPVRRSLLVLLGVCALGAWLQAADRPARGHFLFAYFKGNGEDGLHLAYSRDGLRFEPLKNLRLAFADRVDGPYGPPTAPITGAYWAEGPAAIRIGGQWFVYFDKYVEHRYGLVVSSDLKRWTDASDRLFMPSGARHGSVLQVPAATADTLLALDRRSIP